MMETLNQNKYAWEMVDKKTLLIIVAIIIAGILYSNFNPYASCKRDLKNAYPDLNKQALSMIAADQCG